MSKPANNTTGKTTSDNGKPLVDWRANIHRSKITDPEERRAAIMRATSLIKTDVRLDFVRNRRGR